MSHVSKTAHYNLPIYGGTDIINPLTDVNGTNEALDTAIYEVAQELASGVTDITDVKNKVGDASLDTASQNLSGAVNELKSAIDTQAGDITNIGANVGTLQSQMATTTGNITTLNTTVAGLQTEVSGKASQTAVNTLATKVGTDALITKADNLSGAVNELKNEIDDIDAGDIDYDNTTSGLTATKVQGAIDELNSKVSGKTPDIHFEGTGANLASTLNSLYALIDRNKITPYFRIISNRVSRGETTIFSNLMILPSSIRCSYAQASNLAIGVWVLNIASNNSTAGYHDTSSWHDESATTVAVGDSFDVYY